MNKSKELKKKLLALSLLSIMIGTFSCKNNSKNIDKKIYIPSKYSKVDNYYKYMSKGLEQVKLYDSQYVYLLFDKETYDANEYIYNKASFFKGIELYDLESEEMISYGDLIITNYNLEYFHYLLESCYQIPLCNINDFIDEYNLKKYYTLDEIKELESIIREELKRKTTKIKTK